MKKDEKLKKVTVYLEEEMLDVLDEFAVRYTEETNRHWSRGAVIRLALSEFFTRHGRMI